MEEEKLYDQLIEILKKFDNFKLVDYTYETFDVIFEASDDVLNIISSVINNIKDKHDCSLLILRDENQKEQTYQIQMEYVEDVKSCLILLNKKFLAAQESKGNLRNATNKELGLPDLSLVTIRQIASELKSRENLTFALVWIENNERENIAVEGTGKPNHLIGLLARAQHIAIEWADKNIKFYRPDKDIE